MEVVGSSPTGHTKEIMTHLEKAIKSVEARGLPYYRGLNKQYPIHFASFSNMHNRCKWYGLVTDFPRDYQGFQDFIVYLGDVPIGMKRPTVGRKDHSLGYIKSNFEWQEFADNIEEMTTRFNCQEARIKNTSSKIKNNNLKEFLLSLTNDIEITKVLAYSLGYSGKKPLRNALEKLGKVIKVARGIYLVKA